MQTTVASNFSDTIISVDCLRGGNNEVFGNFDGSVDVTDGFVSFKSKPTIKTDNGNKNGPNILESIDASKCVTTILSLT
jgi:hypothetical protein